ncbi:formimidoylglutamase [Bacteroidetes bacterium endosymbiont of Geopemphigus sp.]|uniref:formimidoylglutamase n=1 Tax=Bacteroidetes bacterium endosymbiont of Geopemphigus sp. TaxID=2047937 RepID=UPI000CD026C2|nr:formimidoylglutamase [Bacteroidetes bacterium endosymbiont of Geopemphigus sp.]
MIQDFLDSKSQVLQARKESLHPFSLCHSFKAFSGDWRVHNEKLALVTVNENRNSEQEIAISTDINNIREALYTLYTGQWKEKLLDIGNILQGASLGDSIYALRQVSGALLKKNILPIIIGGNDLLTYAQYRSHDEIHQVMEVVRVDSRFDLGIDQSPFLTSQTHLNHMIVQEPQKLFNYYHLAYQSYLIAPQEADLMISKLYFECHRLGSLIEDISEAEPVFRSSDMASFDISSIRLADAPGQFFGSPNGLNAREACILARYAGLSNRIKSIGIFGYQSSRDIYGQSAKLIAQMIWHFIEGYFARCPDKAFDNEKDYKRYLIAHEDEPLVFLESISTDRWWMELPCLDKRSKKHYVACSKNDYLKALNGEILDRWWNSYKRYNLK